MTGSLRDSKGWGAGTSIPCSRFLAPDIPTLPPVVGSAYEVVGAVVDRRVAVRSGVRVVARAGVSVRAGARATLVERRACGIKALRQTGGLFAADRVHRERGAEVEGDQRFRGDPRASIAGR